MFLSPSDIKIKKRFRKDVDVGINDLRYSIQDLGQLQPVIVDTNRNLIIGARRVRACELLERDVWVEEVDGIEQLSERLKAEQDENTCRLPFTPSEAVAIGKAILAAEKPKAEQRKMAGVNQYSQPVDNLPTGSKRRAADVAAEAVGMSRTTFEHAAAVVDAAAEPDALPEVIEAARKMDETRKVHPAYKAVMAAVRPAAVIAAPVEDVDELDDDDEDDEVDAPVDVSNIMSVVASYDEFDGIHAACLAIPIGNQRVFDLLVRSIKENGLREPLLRTAGKLLLDGKRRLLACHILGIPIRVVDDGVECNPWSTVNSLNLMLSGGNQIREMMAPHVRERFERECNQNKPTAPTT